MLRIIFRTVLMYLAVCVAVRLMGKRQIGDMQPTELVVTLLISEIAAIALQDASQPVLIGLASMLVLVVLEILASVLILKNTHLRRIFGGKSIVIIKNGKIAFFIEVKDNTAQSGQFVVHPDTDSHSFRFSSKNHSIQNPMTYAIIDYMKEHNLQNVRFQLQIHKFVWDPDAKGV